MSDIWLIRHGTTGLNAEHGGVDRIRGWSDVPLSEKGHQDAEKVSKQLANSGIKILYYSTLQRARDTAAAISKTTGAPLVPAPALRPWNVGIFTGKDSNDAHPQLHKFATQTPDTPIPQGESFNSFKNRVLDALADIMQKSGDNLPGIVTHHRVERLLASWIKAGEPSDRHIDLGTMFQKGEPTGHAEKIDINTEALMPSHSPEQAKTMSAIAHGWKPTGSAAKIPVGVAKEFHAADGKAGHKYGAGQHKGKAKPHQLAKVLMAR